MTDDIVTRLRSYVYDTVYNPWIYAEAADEIERLRERGDDWRAAMTENHDLWNENERLRAALRGIALSFPYKQSSTLRKTARAALAGEKTDA